MSRFGDLLADDLKVRPQCIGGRQGAGHGHALHRRKDRDLALEPLEERSHGRLARSRTGRAGSGTRVARRSPLGGDALIGSPSRRCARLRSINARRRTSSTSGKGATSADDQRVRSDGLGHAGRRAPPRSAGRRSRSLLFSP